MSANGRGARNSSFVQKVEEIENNRLYYFERLNKNNIISSLKSSRQPTFNWDKLMDVCRSLSELLYEVHDLPGAKKKDEGLKSKRHSAGAARLIRAKVFRAP
ncbi:hypothetical protein PUN28_007384 [Cardiocondyla obscurior]|uniref:Uncharacterized protein n=1 Tax=Cardiocondyla obscurior TaxID=286306 RepID=A0AAW2G2Y8_9HYME